MNSELDSLCDVIVHLRKATKEAENNIEEPMDEDNLCTICYANEVAVVFHPCKHTSCRTCIKQQLMSCRECFYCKSNVESYSDIAPSSDMADTSAGGATSSK
uniref:RING-type E3 ubiquitin transferase n=1 Tax=Ciona savignyi TaxID=51511 RepID=H2Y977_CIOSA